MIAGIKNRGFARGSFIVAAGNKARMAQGIKRRICKKVALFPKPWDIMK